VIGRSWIGAGSMSLLLLCVASPAMARGPMPPTHSMALDAVADTVAGDLLKGAAFPSGRPVALAAPAPGDTLGLLTQRMMERMKALGVSVRLARNDAQAPGLVNHGIPATGSPSSLAPGDSASPVVSRGADPAGPLRLEIMVEGSGVTYVRRLGSFPFGTKGYERLAGMRASATLFDPMNGDVVWTRSAARSASDVVAKGDVAYAASGSGYLNPPVPRGGGTRWLEPMIVIGVVAGLVVLFYSNRN
jgi:hypothetical protein